MEYALLKFIHILGAILISSGLIGVWLADLRSRQLRELYPFSEAVRNIAVFYDGLVIPGAILLLISGTWLVMVFFGGWHFMQLNWLSGMIILFLLELVEGNTVTRLYFMRLRRLTQVALQQGNFTPELQAARGEIIPTFTHFLDLPILFLIIALGTIKPNSWQLFIMGTIIALVIAIILTIYIPKLYPWSKKLEPKT
jgi:uncharacterized membrane protein